MSYEKNKQVFDRMVQRGIENARKNGRKENREGIERKVRTIMNKSQK